MRLWQGILASVAVHAALFHIPIRMSAPHEPVCVEVQFVLEAAPAAPRLTDPVTIASVTPPVLPQITVPRPPVVDPEVQKREVIRPKPERKTSPPPQAAPPPRPAAPPAVVAMPLPAAAESVAAAASPEPAEAPPPAAVARLPEPAPGISAAVFGGSGAPGFLKRVLPRYPRLAREMGREGTVTLRLAIDERGVLQEVELIEGAGYGFDEEALRAIRASTFRPAVRNGQPVASRALLPVRFVLRGWTDD
jgi:protein TonB